MKNKDMKILKKILMLIIYILCIISFLFFLVLFVVGRGIHFMPYIIIGTSGVFLSSFGIFITFYYILHNIYTRRQKTY